MLINLKFKPEGNPGLIKMKYVRDVDISNGGLKFTHVYSEKESFPYIVAIKERDGIYWGRNFHNEIRNWTDMEEVSFYKLNLSFEEIVKWPREYGNADNLEQILEYGKKFIECEEPFVLSIIELNKIDNPSFRWHKNGGYIGVKKQEYEHFGDENDIETVIHFNFHRLRNKTEEEIKKDNENPVC